MNEMNRKQIELLRQRMGEVAALAPDDPLRLEVMAEVTAAGAWAEAEWLELQRFDEDARVALRHGDAPEGLADRLGRIPAEAPLRSPWLGRVTKWAAPIAAAIAIGVTVWIANTGHAYTVDQIAELAVDNHLSNNYVQTLTHDPQEVEAKFANTVAWKIDMPELAERSGYELQGARVCRFGGQTVLCTHWTHEGHKHVLYQFCPSDFRMPMTLDDTTLNVDRDAPYRVRVWSEPNGCSYVLISRRD